MRLLVVLSLSLASLSAVAAERSGVLLLERPGYRSEEAALLEALRIYTRDLGRPVRLDGGAPASESAEELARARARGRTAGVEIVLWLAGEGREPALYALRLEPAELRSTPLGAGEIDIEARTLALKVRALLTLTPDAPPRPEWRDLDVPPPLKTPLDAEPDPAPAVSESAAATVAAASVTPTVVARDAPAAPLAVATVVAAPAPRRQVRLELGLAYGFDLPTDPTLLRHGGTLRVGWLPSRWPLAIEADAALTTHPTNDKDAYRVTVSDVPIGLALSWRLPRPPFLFSLGERTSLHIFDGTAEGAGRQGSQRNYSAGIGVLGQARWAALDYLAVVLTLQAEALVPHWRFMRDTTVAADLGAFQFGASLGLVFRLL